MPTSPPTPSSPARVPVVRLVLLGAVLLAGAVLFFTFAGRTAPVVTPATVEAAP
ncbi:MAG TPA: hypothetical protein VFN96_09370 [Gemmatimonadales bacterium]|nr:hypothetical protein [Gemmatimonadales bacterium]